MANITTQPTLLRTTFLVFFLFSMLRITAQKEAEAFNINSSLYSYYQRCQEYLLEPVVLSMADTLFHMATDQNDKRMQAVALSTQLDYYYYQGGNEDSVIHYTDKVKEFSKKTHQPKYYYFAWGNRQILYYLKTRRSNIALYEAEKMLKEAQKENNKTGLLYCYSIMSQIYTIKGFEFMAFEWRLKEIGLTEKYNLENYNITNTYLQLSHYYVAQKQKEEALRTLKKAEISANSISHKALVKLANVNYHSAFGEFIAAQKVLQECREMFNQDKRLDSLKKVLYRTESFYYQQTGQYQKAIQAAEKQAIEEKRLNEHALSNNRYRFKGELYSQMGRLSEAVKYMQMYIKAEDSLKIANEQLASSEFSTLLNVEKLNTEKKELLLQTQKKELRNKTTLIISLTALLGFVFIFLYRESYLNRKLKVSEGKLRTRNEELTVSQEELRIARDRAEASSRMKTTFIQSMSHEIRTPLNSIVGFSQILSENCSKDHPENVEFVEIIKSNSNDLLRLITDVLVLSELDMYKRLPTNIETDINMHCLLAIDSIKSNNHKELEISFTPEKENLVIMSNPERITQLLDRLMHNASKFTTHGSIHLSYSVLEAKGKIQISITDTGIGIANSKQEEVFDRFYKINSFTQGTGLGLSICRSIAQKLGGDIHIDASYTNGCRMILTLPLIYA